MIYNILNKSKQNILPKASEVLNCYLKQQNYPHWTAYFVKYKDVINDQFYSTCFINECNNNEKSKYLILRTGCFPFIKYHCSKLKSNSDLVDDGFVKFQNNFFNLIKLLNFGIPTLAYGISGLFMSTHTEIVITNKGPVKIYFWYKENKRSEF